MNRLAPVGSYLLEVLTEAHVDDLRSKGLLLKCSTVDQGMDLLPCRKIVNIQPTPRFARNLFEIIVRFISLVAVTSGKDWGYNWFQQGGKLSILDHPDIGHPGGSSIDASAFGVPQQGDQQQVSPQ
jgi:hypothetical protein